ncbi:MAG: hypothetical protein MJE63_22450 [Proteobacteria bacterium]|nr:hypothetical protein [Pseudomonadota bacterium]
MKYQLVENNRDNLYNKLLYNSFSSLTTSWIMNNYHINDEDCSMSPGVDFYSLKHYLLRYSDQILAGMSFNLNHRQEYQVEKMGFTLTDAQKHLSCEVLNFFVISIPNRNSFYVGQANVELVQSILETNNLSSVYATCLPKIFPIYSRFGWNLVDEMVLENENKLYLINYSL